MTRFTVTQIAISGEYDLNSYQFDTISQLVDHLYPYARETYYVTEWKAGEINQTHWAFAQCSLIQLDSSEQSLETFKGNHIANPSCTCQGRGRRVPLFAPIPPTYDMKVPCFCIIACHTMYYQQELKP